MKEEKYYSIGQVSNICKIPIKTLRYYDEIGLLIPNIRRETSNYRYYSKEQLIIAFMIRQLRSLGFNLKDIKAIISENKMDFCIDSILGRLREIDDEIFQLEKKRKENESLLKRLREGNLYLKETPKIHEEDLFKIEMIPEMQLLCSRSVSKSYHNEEVSLERWIAINEDALTNGLEITGSIYVTFYTELFGQFFSKDCDIEFAIQVAEDEKVNENIHKFGGFLAATTIYKGNYENIFKTYIALKRWIDNNNYEICGNITEQFIISPIDTRNDDEHVTKIIVPIKMIGKKK